jgi:hypothetical protein
LLDRINRVVMPALVAGIHVFDAGQKDVDGRNKSGHDDSADVLYLPAPADVAKW